ncbi:MAG TPA: nitrite reductase small subunit NirD [Acetobacteraceae bacterium]|jgi:nitrite reductase (NADH) small subunit|nr:nitrite reductase small subunit NirD [Acetobacteraceae bacterium]
MDGTLVSDESIDVAGLEEIPRRGARTVVTQGETIALFRTGEDRVFALADRCPHRGGPLSHGIVHGERVTCPLHNWVIALATGIAEGEEAPCVPCFRVRVEDGRILLSLNGA